MPIANCFVPDTGPAVDAGRVVRAWSAASGVEDTEMTVNLVRTSGQGGRGYAAMAWLYLPTLWSAADVDALQRGLAGALGEVLDAPPDTVTVLTTMLASGTVVEGGEILRW
jgi:hypothetical protein